MWKSGHRGWGENMRQTGSLPRAKPVYSYQMPFALTVFVIARSAATRQPPAARTVPAVLDCRAASAARNDGSARLGQCEGPLVRFHKKDSQADKVQAGAYIHATAAARLKRFASGPDANRFRFFVCEQLLAASGPATSRRTRLQTALGLRNAVELVPARSQLAAFSELLRRDPLRKVIGLIGIHGHSRHVGHERDLAE